MSRSRKKPWFKICGAERPAKDKRLANKKLRARCRASDNIEDAPTKLIQVSQRWDWLDWIGYRPDWPKAYRK